MIAAAKVAARPGQDDPDAGIAHRAGQRLEVNLGHPRLGRGGGMVGDRRGERGVALILALATLTVVAAGKRYGTIPVDAVEHVPHELRVERQRRGGDGGGARGVSR